MVYSIRTYVHNISIWIQYNQPSNKPSVLKINIKLLHIPIFINKTALAASTYYIYNKNIVYSMCQINCLPTWMDIMHLTAKKELNASNKYKLY